MEDTDFNARVQSIEGLVQQMDSLRDPSARAAALDLVRAIMDVHSAGLARILQIAAQSDDAAISPALLKDDVVTSLLLLHGLHPSPIEVRVAQALEKLEPFLRRRSATAQLLSIEDGVVRVKVEGGPPMSGASLRQAVEEAIYSLAPEADEVLVDCPQEAPSGFVPLSSLVTG